MASWLSSLQDKAENFLEQVDQVAANKLTLATPGRLRSDGTLSDDLEPEPTNKASFSEERAAKQADSLTLINGANSAVDKVTLSPVTTRSSKLKLEPTPASGTAPVTGDGGPLQMENKMLRSEIAALEDEIASFSSRIRSTQDALSETKESLVNARQQLSEATAARNKLNTENSKFRDSLAGKEKELSTTQASASALREDLRLATQQRDAMLADHLRATEMQNRVMENMRTELDTLRAGSRTGESALASARHETEERARTLGTALAEKERLTADLQGQLEYIKGV